jgi:hypothetical protein
MPTTRVAASWAGFSGVSGCDASDAGVIGGAGSEGERVQERELADLDPPLIRRNGPPSARLRASLKSSAEMIE